MKGNIHTNKHLVVIAGPTAVGKTDLAIKLAKLFKTEIVSFDSRQFYREMSIGTAKPDKSQLESVKHHFIDSHSVDQLYGAGHFSRDAEEVLQKLFEKHSVVIAVGGSGLYIEALLNGVDEFGETDRAIREDIIKNYRRLGLTWLQEEVKKRDEVFFKNADQQNPQRLMRALEVCIQSGLPYSGFLKNRKTQKNYNNIPLLVTLPREQLYERINQRVDKMIEAGLGNEVKNLEAQQHLNALKTVGYREFIAYLHNECSLEEAIEKIKQHSRNYAKRQLTWFRNRGNYIEFDVRDEEKIIKHIEAAIA